MRSLYISPIVVLFMPISPLITFVMGALGALAIVVTVSYNCVCLFAMEVSIGSDVVSHHPIPVQVNVLIHHQSRTLELAGHIFQRPHHKIFH